MLFTPLLLCLQGFGQTHFEASYSDGLNTRAFDVIEDGDRIVVFGFNHNTIQSLRAREGLILILDGLGMIESVLQLSNEKDGLAISHGKLAGRSRDYYVAGNTTTNGTTSNDFFLFKVHDDAVVEQTLAVRTTDDDQFRDFMVSETGAIYLIGDNGGAHPVMVKFSESGELLWSQRYDLNSTGVSGQFRNIVELPDRDILTTGLIRPRVNGGNQLIVSRVTPNGQLEYMIQYNSGLEVVYEDKPLVRLSNGHYLIVENLIDEDGRGVFGLIEITPDGTPVRSEKVTANASLLAKSITVNSDGLLVIGGQITADDRDSDAFVCILNEALEIQATYMHGEPNADEHFNKLIEYDASGEGFLVGVGESVSPDGDISAYLVSMNRDGASGTKCDRQTSLRIADIAYNTIYGGTQFNWSVDTDYEVELSVGTMQRNAFGCFTINLDADGSSGANDCYFRASGENCVESRNGMPIADDDLSLTGIDNIDSVTISLVFGVLDGDNEVLSGKAATNVRIRVDGPAQISLINNGNADLADFEAAIRDVRYSNIGAAISPGMRQIGVMGYAGTEVSNLAIAELNLVGGAPYLLPDIGDTSLCQGGTVRLRLPEDPDVFVQWTDGSEGFEIDIDSPGWYGVRTESACGIDSLTFRVSLTEELASQFLSYELCTNKELLISAEDNMTRSYRWLDNDSDNPVRTIDRADRYLLERVGMCNTVIDTIDIVEIPGLQYNDQRPASIRACDSTTTVDVSTINAIDYLWSDGSRSPISTITQSGDHSVEIFGLCDTLKIDLSIALSDCCTFYMPNAFSPNLDGTNDSFGPETYKCLFEKYELSIYDRFGNRVFQSRAPEVRWDGRFRDNLCEAMSYVWVLDYKLYGREAGQKQGLLNLIR